MLSVVVLSGRRLRQRKEVWAGEISAEVEEFQELQGVLSRYLERNASSEANLWCERTKGPDILSSNHRNEQDMILQP